MFSLGIAVEIIQELLSWIVTINDTGREEGWLGYNNHGLGLGLRYVILFGNQLDRYVLRFGLWLIW